MAFKGIVYCHTQADYDNLQNKDANKLYLVEETGITYTYATEQWVQTNYQSKLVPNGSESASQTLTSLKIDNTVYSISGGGGGGTSDYTALSNKPQINSITLSGNKTSSDLGLYSKPASGIPATDLTNAVQLSLDRADSALQSLPNNALTTDSEQTITADKKLSASILDSSSNNVLTVDGNAVSVGSEAKNTSIVGDNVYLSPKTGGIASYKGNEIATTSDISGKQDALTQAQLNAVNSGITSNKVSTYDGYATNKQDTISDLSTIRTGAGLGATAVQPSGIANMLTTDTTQTISADKTLSAALVDSNNNNLLTTDGNTTTLGDDAKPTDIDGENVYISTAENGKVYYNGDEIAVKDDLPDTSNFLTKNTPDQVISVDIKLSGAGFIDSNGGNIIKSDISTEIKVGNSNLNTTIEGDAIYLSPANDQVVSYKGHEVATVNDIPSTTDFLTTNTTQTITANKTLSGAGFLDSNSHNVLSSDVSTQITVGNTSNNTEISGDEIYLNPSQNGKVHYKGYEVATANDISDSRITIKQGSVSKGYFTLNQSNIKTITLNNPYLHQIYVGYISDLGSLLGCDYICVRYLSSSATPITTLSGLYTLFNGQSSTNNIIDITADFDNGDYTQSNTNRWKMITFSLTSAYRINGVCLNLANMQAGARFTEFTDIQIPSDVDITDTVVEL